MTVWALTVDGQWWRCQDSLDVVRDAVTSLVFMPASRGDIGMVEVHTRLVVAVREETDRGQAPGEPKERTESL